MGFKENDYVRVREGTWTGWVGQLRQASGGDHGLAYILFPGVYCPELRASGLFVLQLLNSALAPATHEEYQEAKRAAEDRRDKAEVKAKVAGITPADLEKMVVGVFEARERELLMRENAVTQREEVVRAKELELVEREQDLVMGETMGDQAENNLFLRLTTVTDEEAHKSLNFEAVNGRLGSKGAKHAYSNLMNNWRVRVRSAMADFLLNERKARKARLEEERKRVATLVAARGAGHG